MMNVEKNNPPLVTDDETRRAHKLIVALTRCFDAIAEGAKKNISQLGLIPSEFGVLEMLYHKGPVPLSEVGEKLLLTSGSITYVVDKLEKRGLVKRVACPEDRRIIYADLTEEGRELICETFPPHAEVIRDLVSGLSAEEQEIATVLLRKMGLHAKRSKKSGE
jgi:MarR family 2-MHQ and catechol resistance regulon transcriptional repressor